MNEATEFEILRSLHTLWLRGGLISTEVSILLKNQCGILLTSLTETEINGESTDGKTKYRIGRE